MKNNAVTCNKRMRKDHSYTNSRFAWLTPLAGHMNNNGPWLIVEENTSAIAQRPTEQCRKVTLRGLLQMISDVLYSTSESGSKTARSHWGSSCGRFSVRLERADSDDSRLFVQRAEDYFSRIELWLDGQLLVAFQEPVWPHLQTGNTSMSNHLSIPADCLDALEAGALASKSIPASNRGESIASAA